MTSNGNMAKTLVLLTMLTVLLVTIGRVVAGTGGMVLAFAFAVAMNFTSYWFSDRIALSMAGAHELSDSEAPDLHRLVERVAAEANLPKPRVYGIQNDSPNAFATGRDPQHAAIAVTAGIMRTLNQSEIEAVIAHELGHVRNRDTLTMAVTATVAGAIIMIAHMAQWAMLFGGFGGLGGRRDSRGGMGDVVVGLLMIILAPIAATIIQLAISRAREFEADATGARICHNPLALASALEKLEAATHEKPMAVPQTVAHVFIVNPLGGRGFEGLFRTHPSTAERVARLQAMAAGVPR
jgi:heat shock protein HtpX